MTDFKEENQTITLTIPTQGSIPVISISNWIFFMHRDMSNGFNWNLTWIDYKNGFGSSSWDFWMGLERLHLLTTSSNYRLRVEWQENVTGSWLSVEYWSFYIEDEAAYYKLRVSGYVPGDDGRALCVYETVFILHYSDIFIHVHKVGRVTKRLFDGMLTVAFLVLRKWEPLRAAIDVDWK